MLRPVSLEEKFRQAPQETSDGLSSVAEVPAHGLWSSCFFTDFSGCGPSLFALLLLAVIRPRFSEGARTLTEHG